MLYRCEDFDCKNAITREGGFIRVSMTNTPMPVTFLANWSDIEAISLYRWRYIDGRVMTSREDPDGIERGWPIENVILNRPRKIRIPHKNGDPLDCRRHNLDAPRERPALPPSPIRVDGSTAFIQLESKGKKYEAILDRADVPKVSAYHWVVAAKRDNAKSVRISARMTVGTKVTTVLLHRHLLAIEPYSRHVRVHFQNGDPFDFRRSNLLVTVGEVPCSP